jgi:hypothetical protein
MHSSILQRIWLNFMAQYLVFSALIEFSLFFPDFQLFRPKYHWRDLSSRNAHLVHQNWYRISFTSPNDNLYHIWLILACRFWKRFFKIFCLFLLFYYYLPFERCYPLPLKTLESSHSKDDLCQVWLKLVLVEKKIFKWPHPNFYIFVIISPLKRTWPFIWTN